MNLGNVVLYGVMAVVVLGGVMTIALTLFGRARADTSWVLLDASGERVGDAAFEDARRFAGEVAPACVDGRWGYVDRSGAWVIAPQYAAAEPFGPSGYAAVQSSERPLWGVINASGEWVVEPAFLAFGPVGRDGRVVVRQGIGLTASSGVQRVSVGIYDVVEGEWVVPPLESDDRLMDGRGPGLHGQVAVQTKGGWQLMDARGDVLGDTELWDHMWAPSDGRVRVERQGRQGFLNLDGTVVIEARYGAASDMVGGVASVRTRDGSQLIDRDGTVVSGVFRDMLTPSEGRIAARSADGLWGFIGPTGDWELPPQWSAIGVEGFVDGVARVGVDVGLRRQWQWVDVDGEPVGPRARALTVFADGRGFAQGRVD